MVGWWAGGTYSNNVLLDAKPGVDGQVVETKDGGS